MIVVDASTWVNFYLNTLPDRALTRLTTDSEPVGPWHVNVEVASGLLRCQHQGQLGDAQARPMIEEFLAHPFERTADTDDLHGAFDLLNNARYPDAVYLAMARRLKCPVLTADKGMIDAARIHNIDVVDARDGTP